METAFITGANKGLGFETARYLLQNGYFVYLGYRNSMLGKEAISRLHAQDLTQCDLIEIDVTDQNSVDAAKRMLSTKTDVLDVLINNAGILGRIPTPENPHTLADVKHVFETNFFGVIRVTEAFLPQLKNSQNPRIVNVTSDLGSLTLHQDPNWKYSSFKSITYPPSKTALNAYTLMMAFKLKDFGIKVNCVTPGHTATDFNNYRGTLKPEDTCKIIARYAMIGNDGPTGKFFGAEGELPW